MLKHGVRRNLEFLRLLTAYTPEVNRSRLGETKYLKTDYIKSARVLPVVIRFMQQPRKRLNTEDIHFAGMGKNKNKKKSQGPTPDQAGAALVQEDEKHEAKAGKKQRTESECKSDGKSNAQEAPSPETKSFTMMEFDAGFEENQKQGKKAAKSSEKKKKDEKAPSTVPVSPITDSSQTSASESKPTQSSDEPVKEAKQKKKAKADIKKIPKAFNYLLYRGGAEEKGITFQTGGYINMNDVLDIEQYSHWLKDDVVDALSEQGEFVVQQCRTTGKTQVKAAKEVTKDAAVPNDSGAKKKKVPTATLR